MRALRFLPALPGSKNRRAVVECPLCHETVVRRADTIRRANSCGCGRKKYATRQEARRAYYENNKDKLKEAAVKWKLQNATRLKRWYQEYHLKKKYGLSFEEFKAIGQRQGRVCAICKTQRGRRVVYHDHRARKVRGILCHQCNSALGLFQENCKWLQSAINYLKEAA